ncbi:hypothetical protein ACFQY7_34810 [Actinomadura luteofluorescens]|uniref:Uncharacterized protein n=1 Tax=Actinomadura luteofluorescens TaxID=46163 RepID=A0A7Y9JHS5_9ACTN|nr:hypothetical protein [Actinomadura luteofluorescens]NYD49071.1 hypothetical protein [Actinomadura luteofluorescens]
MTLDYPPRPNRARPGAALDALCAVLRGLWAVARLLAGAVAALASAALGTPPASATRLGHLIADEYRAGRAGAIDAEVIDDPDDHPLDDPRTDIETKEESR